MTGVLVVSLPLLVGVGVWVLTCSLRRRNRIEEEFRREWELRRHAAIIRGLSNHVGRVQGAEEGTIDFKVAAHGEPCGGCGVQIYGEAFRLPHLSGYHCSVECVKAHLSAGNIGPRKATKLRLVGTIRKKENVKFHVRTRT